MSGHSKFRISAVGDLQQTAQKALLPAFCLLSIFIILFPFHYSFGFAQIEGLDISGQPWLFALLLDAWVFLGVVALAKSERSRARTAELLIVISMAVIPGLLTVKMAPLGVDHSYDITFYGAAYIGSTHSIPVPPPTQVGYLAYPGIMLLTYSVSSVLGLPLILSGSLLQVGFYTVMGIAMYELTKKLTGNSVVSSLTLPLFFFCTIESGNLLLLFPAAMGASLLVLALLLIAKGGAPASVAEISVLAVIILAMTITHFYDPLTFVFVLMLLYVTVGKRSHSSRIGVVLLFAVITFTAYFSLFAVNFFGPIVLQSEESFIHILSGVPQNYALQVVSTNTFGVPFWAAASKYLDLGLTSIVGSIAALYYASRSLWRKNLAKDDLMLRYSMGAVGILLFGAVIFLASLSSGGAAADFFAALQWVVFFSLPIALSLAARNRKFVTGLVVCTAIISAPSLYALVTPQISTITVYPSNVAASSFLVNHAPTLNLIVFIDGKNAGVLGSLDPFAKPDFYSVPLPAFKDKTSEANLVDTSYSYYQQHLYGFAINYSAVFETDVIYSGPHLYILPPIA